MTKIKTVKFIIPSICTNSKAMLRTSRLRNDLTENDNQQSRAERGINTGQHIAQNKRRHRVDEHITQENRTQEEITPLTQRIDLGRVGLLLRRANTLEDVELGQIERHETQIETTKQAAEC